MSTPARAGRRPVPPPSGRATWWLVFGLLSLVGGVWIVAAPLFTGPDEVSQARRAAAVVRGQLVGDRRGPGPALLVDVEVPALYGSTAEDQWRCFLGPLVRGTPQEPMALPPASCGPLDATGGHERAGTVQYRGQPFFYGLVGLPTLASEGEAGAYVMRLLGLVVATAFLASAFVSARRARTPALAGAALLLAITPAVIYLAASTNPSGLEIAAALSAWAAGMVLADPATVADRRLVARFGVALVVLVLTRGLSPAFVTAIVVVTGVVAGRSRVVELVRRVDVRAWAAVLLAATGATVLWLAHIQAEYPLPDRPGSGVVDTIGWLPWYLRQSVGVFGTNDSALPPLVAGVWIGVSVLVLVVGVLRSPRRVGVLAGIVALSGLGLSVTAEGLSLPPIGFFWQGRYALPLLLGALVVATWRAEAADLPAGVVEAFRFAVPTVVVGAHTWAFVTVGRHHAARAGSAAAHRTATILDPATGRPTGSGTAVLLGNWAPPLPQPVLTGLYGLGLFALVLVVTAPGARGPRAGPAPAVRVDDLPDHQPAPR
jgi:hypothetical protein